MKKIITLLVVIIFTLAGTVTAANYTMSWDFEIFNDANATQVALNNAQIQDELAEEEEDPLERFKEGLERRLYSAVQRSIVDMITGDSEAYGEFEVGNLEVSVAEDPDTGEVIVDIYNTETGESTTITYAPDEYIW
ncbi:MAG: curli assembly protein CsgF [Halanaerobiaceae bacterium]